MKLFRISQEKYINDLQGTGAKLFGGRWNRPGRAVLYTSAHRSLALLELMIHFGAKKAFKLNYSFIELEIDHELVVNLDKKLLPANEIEFNDENLWRLSDYYFGKLNVLALKVPSILIPQEYNIVLNCEHPEFNKVLALGVENINLDERFKNLEK